jgi:uncharacterized paraquat-inducible protein A
MINLKKIRTFFKSLFWHIWSGFPKSTLEQIKQRYEICLNCEMFDAKNSQCLVCGCNLSTKKIFMNKLAWADQECPMKKWKKIT